MCCPRLAAFMHRLHLSLSAGASYLVLLQVHHREQRQLGWALHNYVNALDGRAPSASRFWFTALASPVVSTVLINVLAFAIALLLTRGIKGTNIFRTVFFMPNLIGGIVLGYIWQILINGVLAPAGNSHC